MDNKTIKRIKEVLLDIRTSEFLSNTNSREVDPIPEGTGFKSTVIACTLCICRLYIPIGIILLLIFESDIDSIDSSVFIVISLFVLTTLTDKYPIRLSSLNYSERIEFKKMNDNFKRDKLFLSLLVIIYSIQYSITGSSVFSIEGTGFLGLYKLVAIGMSGIFLSLILTDVDRLLRFVIKEEVGIEIGILFSQNEEKKEKIEEDELYLDLC